MRRSLGFLTVATLLLAACAQSGGTLPPASSPQAFAPMRAASGYRVVYNFQRAPDATFPSGPLVSIGGTLYGTTAQGGSHNGGTLYSISASGKESIVHSFSGYTASYGGPPSEPTGLTTIGGSIYGMTAYGGSGGCTDRGVRIGCGTLFSYTPGGSVRTIYNFSLATALPLALASGNGKLYGATGSYVFSTTTSGTFRTIYKF
ncbi:MAG: hypothetical protein JO199_11800, partial [Candidatus Eremiobacteraeota bacterium]|nr:hypothetical protein [Candidatus Eremiobacteraeota bacterium]